MGIPVKYQMPEISAIFENPLERFTWVFGLLKPEYEDR